MSYLVAVKFPGNDRHYHYTSNFFVLPGYRVKTPTGEAHVVACMSATANYKPLLGIYPPEDADAATTTSSRSLRRKEIMKELADLQEAQDTATKYLALAKVNPKAKKLIAEYKKLV